MSEAKYYLISDETNSPFVATDDSGATVQTFATEGEAIQAAKVYGDMIVVRGVARVVEVSKHKVERFK